MAIVRADRVQHSDGDTDMLLDKSDAELFESASKANQTQSPDESTKKGRKGEKEGETFWKWLFRKPWSKLPFMYFLFGVLGVPALAVFHFMDADTCYILCGAYIALNIFGLKHFYTLIGMKQQVDTFGSLNLQFRREQRQLELEVRRIEAANANLRESHDRMQAANAKNRENLKQFSTLQTTMKQLNLQSMDELKGVASKVDVIGDKWKDKLVEHERDMLHTVFDRFELASGKAGMTKAEFHKFSQQLPVSYQRRFARLGTFETLSHDGVYLNFSDFDAALDLFAEMDALDCDIEFSIEKDAHNPHLPMQLQSFEPVLEVESIEDMDEDEMAAMALTKRWKTRRKSYKDNVKRKIVIHRKVFRTLQARHFTSALGLSDLDEGTESDEQPPKPVKTKPKKSATLSLRVPDDESDEEADADELALLSRSPNGFQKEDDVTEIIAAGRKESARQLLQ